MPVTVQCFQCNAILTLDDGFRGGVARCSACGTLLQVPRGEDTPTARKPRPATPPSPTASPTPIQNATSSKLDVGLSRGQFDAPSSSQLHRQDVGLSSGLGARVHPTTPIAAAARSPAKPKRRKSSPPTTTQVPLAPSKPAPPAPRPRNRMLFWLGVILILLIIAVITTFVIYYIYYS